MLSRGCAAAAMREQIGPAGAARGARGGLAGRPAANAYIDRQAPWALRKTDPARMGAVLRVLADTIRAVGDRAAAVHAWQHGADARPARGASGRAELAALDERPADRQRVAAAPGAVSTLDRRSCVGVDADRFSLPPGLLHGGGARRRCWSGPRQAGVAGMVTIGTRLSHAAEQNWPCRRDARPVVHDRHASPSCRRGRVAAGTGACVACSHPRVIGVGEAGLDYFYDKAPRDGRQTLSARQIRAARLRRTCRSASTRATPTTTLWRS